MLIKINAKSLFNLLYRAPLPAKTLPRLDETSGAVISSVTDSSVVSDKTNLFSDSLDELPVRKYTRAKEIIVSEMLTPMLTLEVISLSNLVFTLNQPTTETIEIIKSSNTV